MNDTLDTLNRLISEAFNDLSSVEHKALRDSGFNDISVSEAHTVDAIGLYMPKKMSDVSGRLKITMGTLTVSVNHLVKKGYVLKKKNEFDKRMVMLSLTDKGRQLYKAHQRFHLELVKSLIVDLSEYEAEMFIQALNSLNGFLEDKSAVSC